MIVFQFACIEMGQKSVMGNDCSYNKGTEVFIKGRTIE